MPPRYRKILPKILSAKAEADVPFVRKIAISETAVTPQGYSKAAIYGCQGALLKRNSFKAPFICTNARPLENPLYMLYNTTEFKAHCMCLEFNSNTEEQKMFCPNCGNHILDANASFCPNCGARKPEEKHGWSCPECGTKNIMTNFCPNCGRKKDESC